MKKKLKDILLLNTVNNGLVSVHSTAGQGKTSLLSILTAELYYEGKNVLFLTNENQVKDIRNKVFQALSNFTCNLTFEELEKTTLTFKKYPMDVQDVDVIRTCFEKQKYDIVLIDSIKPDFRALSEFSHQNNCVIICNGQINRNLKGESQPIESLKVLQFSDAAFILSIKKDSSFWIELKYFFCFWLTRPNKNLAIVKNRYGKIGNTDIHLDFEKLKIS